MPRHHIDTLLNTLSRQLGMDALALDGSDHCILRIDEGPELHLEYFEAEDLVVLAAALPPIDGALRESAYRMLLKANFMWQGTHGATLALNPESDAVIVQHKLTAQGADPEGFQAILDGFDGLCRLCADNLAKLTPKAAQGVSDSTEYMTIRG